MVPTVSFQSLSPPLQFLPGSLSGCIGNGGRLMGHPLQQIKACAEGGGRLRQFRFDLLQLGVPSGQLAENSDRVAKAGEKLRGEDWLGR